MSSKEAELAIVRRTKELLSAGWVQGVMATDASGYGVDPCSDNMPTSFCLAGAMDRIRFLEMIDKEDSFPYVVMRIQDMLFRLGLGRISRMEFNDGPFTTKQKVLELLDKIEEEILNGNSGN